MNKTIYQSIAALFIAFVATGCGDNYDAVYEPVKSIKVLTVTPSSINYSPERNELTLASTSSTTTIVVESNTRWSVEVSYPADSESRGWLDASVYNGSGNDMFDISVLENIGDPRKCSISVSAIDAEGNVISGSDGAFYTINVVQNNSNVRLTPTSVQPFVAVNPQSQDFNIIADDGIEWDLTLTCEETNDVKNAEFMKIRHGEDIQEISSTHFAGKGNSSFTLSLETNRISADRIGFVTLESGLGSYTVEIRQLATEFTFDVSLDDMKDLPAEGGSLQFGVYSPQIAWEIQGVPSWASFDVLKGDALGSRVVVMANIESNPSSVERSAMISFVPVGENADLYQKYNVTISQAASPRPVLSTPWILNFTNSEVEIEYNYYSPIRRIESAYLMWCLYDEQDPSDKDWNINEVEDFEKDQTSGSVRMKIDGLKTATTYLFRGRLITSDGEIIDGNITEPFTTAGVLPGESDNPTPGS
ncbi:MAG: hypothetical protein NC095_04705 [Muribaculum sp.]|nr:hypothetical protein [Muribaculum sp.]